MMEEATKSLIGALLKAQSEITHAVDDGENPVFKSAFATLEGVIDAVKPVLNANGIYYQQVSHDCDNGISVETIFYGHDSFLKTGKVTIPADKNTCQGYGSALTYAKRYSLSMAAGIGHQPDDDGNEAEKNAPKSKPQPVKTKEKTPAVKVKDNNNIKESVEIAKTVTETISALKNVKDIPDESTANQVCSGFIYLKEYSPEALNSILKEQAYLRETLMAKYPSLYESTKTIMSTK
tara:strand:- start:3060 stop:3767 length:708 start_codon:yes stop_codon:yes gene_type:complete